MLHLLKHRTFRFLTSAMLFPVVMLPLAFFALIQLPLASAQTDTVGSVALAGDLPEYRAEIRQQSSLSSIGSDSMGGLMSRWVLAYRKFQPNVRLQVVSRGSALAPAALVEGTADLGPMARPMKTGEREEFLSRYGFEPTEVRAAASVAAVYVHADNPLESISIAQLEQIFGARPKRGDNKRIRRWKELVAETDLAGAEVVPVGQATDSYLSGYFKQRVLLQSEFVSSMKQAESASAVFETIRGNPATIGFAEFRLAPPVGVKVLKVRKDESSVAFSPARDTIADGSYPLSRYLSIYLVRSPGESVDEAAADFLRFVLSRQGQELVEQLGMRPLSGEEAREELAKLL